MVGPGLLLTNRHVLPTKEVAASSMVEFGYEKDERGVAKPSTQVISSHPQYILAYTRQCRRDLKSKQCFIRDH